jgi:hypothetical protein
MPNVIDTQVMAAFAGVGDQVGLASLANELLRVTLAKEQQWTDWAKRPLSEAQLAYAAADVRHLPAIYAKLALRLGDRMQWARAESTAVAADALAAVNVTPDEAWRAIGGLRGLDGGAFAIVRVLAGWRLRVATELDKPIGWVLAEKAIIDFARRPPDAEAIRSYKGLAQLARQRADELAELIADAQPDGAVLAIVRRRPHAHSDGRRCCSRSCSSPPSRPESRHGYSPRGAMRRSWRAPSTSTASTALAVCPPSRPGATPCLVGSGRAGCAGRSRSSGSATRAASRSWQLPEIPGRNSSCGWPSRPRRDGLRKVRSRGRFGEGPGGT